MIAKYMKSLLALSLTVASLTGVLVINALADTRYVSDNLVVAIRNSADPNSDVVRYLKSDTKLEVLQEDDRMVNVRLGDSTEGWIAKRYVTAELPKAQVIKQLQEELQALREKTGSLKADLKDERSESGSAIEELAALKKTHQELSAQYEELVKNSGTVIETVKERDMLRTEASRLNERLFELEQEVTARNRTEKILWFLAGGGVLFFGWILGKSSRNRRHY